MGDEEIESSRVHILRRTLRQDVTTVGIEVRAVYFDASLVRSFLCLSHQQRATSPHMLSQSRLTNGSHTRRSDDGREG